MRALPSLAFWRRSTRWTCDVASTLPCAIAVARLPRPRLVRRRLVRRDGTPTPARPPKQPRRSAAGQARRSSVPDDAPETLEVVDITEGTGAQVAAHDWVQVDYVGVSQSTGEEFDSSYDREPVEFPLDQVIPGWSEGLLGMKEGGRRQLVIPADMAYGDTPPRGFGDRPRRGAGLRRRPAGRHGLLRRQARGRAPRRGTRRAGDRGHRGRRRGRDRRRRRGHRRHRAVRRGLAQQRRGVRQLVGQRSAGQVQFDITQVIEGWSEGLVGMKEGGRRRLIIPPTWRYGDDPPPGVDDLTR